MNTDNKVSVIALATRNPGKIEEMRLRLAGSKRGDGIEIEIRAVTDYPGFPEVEETEATLRGNAALKSEALFAFSGTPSLADDTGLHVDALGGAPGVRSARFAGDQCTPADNRSHLLKSMKGIADRSARFETVLAFTDRTGTLFFDGECRGRILGEEHGSGGFGYDSLFQPDGSGLTFAELPPEVKNGMSHRGRALEKFLAFIRDYRIDQ